MAIVQRLNPDGSPDSSGSGYDTGDKSGSADGLRAVIASVSSWNDIAMDRRGRVVVVGEEGSGGFLLLDGRMVVARYLGQPFQSFGSGLGCPTCSYAPPAVCGNGFFEFGEQCDDGNTAAGDGCSDTCETELDPDADGILDIADSCVNTGGTQDFMSGYVSRISVTRSTTSAGANETLDLAGVFQMPSGWRFEDFDPNGVDRYSGGRGVQLVVTNGYPSRILDSLVIDDGPDRSWTQPIPSEWRYVNGIPEDNYPVLSMLIWDAGEGRVGVTAKARKSAFQGAVSSSLDVPLKAMITLGRREGAGQNAECGESRFEAAECSWNAAGTKFRCRPQNGGQSGVPACGLGAELALLLPLLLAWRRRRMQDPQRAPGA